ncbi:MAG: RDD family protein [Vicinamibacteria bacterium]
MNCPACGRGLPPGPIDRCPFCAAMLAVPQHGALAPDLRSRMNVEPMREIPGARKRERTWKDEVRDRVKSRKEQRGDLPLFQDDDPALEEPAEIAEIGDRIELATDEAAPAEAAEAQGIRELGDEDEEPARDVLDLLEGRAPAAEPELLLQPELEDVQLPAAVAAAREEEPEESTVIQWSLGPRHSSRDEPSPVERPAPLLARAEAALLDALLLAVLGAGVVALTARAAQVPVAGLLPSWPWLSGYLVALGLLYAGYFTGGTGRTVGKMAFGLYVVDSAGHRPGFVRAFARAALGVLGIVLAAAGLAPMFVDPARRAFHDRLFGTRVIQA